MIIEDKISIYDFVNAISELVDLVSPAMSSHHSMVAYIAFRIAYKMNLPSEEIQDITLASMLHDIGAFTVDERVMAQRFETDEFDAALDKHAFVGYNLLRNFEPLAGAAELIRHHHSYFNKSIYGIPIGSYIIQLADRVSVLLDEDREIFSQLRDVLAVIEYKQDMFHPGVYDTFLKLIGLEYVWIGIFSQPIRTSVIKKRMTFSKEIIDLEALRSFAKVIAQVIDFKNRFTATHSSGVAAVAMELAEISGFSERECRQMEIAGFLHDLGKLAVPNAILEKNGALNSEEINQIKKHTYYTYYVLSKINGLEQIATWAAYHHEREDGKGYPFHVDKGDFPLLARIMAVADIVTALTEDRPYRLGMSKENTFRILFSMVENGGIDGNIVELAYKNFNRIHEAQTKANQRARKEYEAFHNSKILDYACIAV